MCDQRFMPRGFARAAVVSICVLSPACKPWGLPIDGETHSGTSASSGASTGDTATDSTATPTTGDPTSVGETTGTAGGTTAASTGVDETTGSLSSTSVASTGDTTTGGSPCGLQWQQPFVYGEANASLELTHAARDPAGDLILVGVRGDGSSFVIKIDATTGQATEQKTNIEGTEVQDVAVNNNGIYLAGYKPEPPSYTDSFVARLDDVGGTVTLQGGGLPATNVDKAYALTLAADGRVATTGYCGNGKQLMVGLRDSALVGKAFDCTPNNGMASDIRGWGIVETAGGFLVAGQWSDTLDLPPSALDAFAPAQANFLAFFDETGVAIKSIALPMFGSTRVTLGEYSSLPAVALDVDADENIFVAGRMKSGVCTDDCVPIVAGFDANGVPKAGPTKLTAGGGVVTDIEVDPVGGVFVAGATGVSNFSAEGVSRSGRAFGSQIGAELDSASLRSWAMSGVGCGMGSCSSIQSVIVDRDDGIVFWAGNFKSTETLVWVDDDGDPNDDPELNPVKDAISNIFVIAECVE